MKLLQMKPYVVFLTSIFILISPALTNAQKSGAIPELLQEFFLSETVFPQQKNELQLTARPTFWKNKNLSYLQIPVWLEYGFTNRFQVELTVPVRIMFPRGQKPVADTRTLEAGLLYNIVNRNKPFALSAGLDIEWATAKDEEEIGEVKSRIAWEPIIIIARQFGRTQVHANLGAELIGNEAEFPYGLATATSLGHWIITMEITGEMHDNKTIFLSPGLIWKGIDDFELGAGVSKGRSIWGLTLMATYELPLGTPARHLNKIL